MIKMTWGQIRNPQFNPVMQKIMATAMPLILARRLLKIAEEVQSEQAASDKIFADLQEKYLEPVATNPNLMGLKSSLSDEEKALGTKLLEEFLTMPVELSFEQIADKELSFARLSPAELSLVSGLICAD